MKLIDKIFNDNYFGIKKFEQDGKIYEDLGVRQFKKQNDTSFFDERPKSEQLQLFQAMQTTLFSETKEDIAAMVGDIREVRDSATVMLASIAAASP